MENFIRLASASPPGLLLNPKNKHFSFIGLQQPTEESNYYIHTTSSSIPSISLSSLSSKEIFISPSLSINFHHKSSQISRNSSSALVPPHRIIPTLVRERELPSVSGYIFSPLPATSPIRTWNMKNLIKRPLSASLSFHLASPSITTPNHPRSSECVCYSRHNEAKRTDGSSA